MDSAKETGVMTDGAETPASPNAIACVNLERPEPHELGEALHGFSKPPDKFSRKRRCSANCLSIVVASAYAMIIITLWLAGWRATSSIRHPYQTRRPSPVVVPNREQFCTGWRDLQPQCWMPELEDLHDNLRGATRRVSSGEKKTRPKRERAQSTLVADHMRRSALEMLLWPHFS